MCLRFAVQGGRRVLLVESMIWSLHLGMTSVPTSQTIHSRGLHSDRKLDVGQHNNYKSRISDVNSQSYQKSQECLLLHNTGYYLFFFNLNSMNEEWYFFSASIYIFLKNEDEHFSICLLAIFISSENSYSLSFFPLVVYLIESRKQQELFISLVSESFLYILILYLIFSSCFF